MKTEYFFCTVKAIDETERTIDVIASTDDPDRDGDVIEPSAFKKSLGSFKANPVILAGHQHRLGTGSSPVIGSAIPETIEIADKTFGFRMRFATTKLGEEYWALYRDKHMRAFSVGFIPQKSEDIMDSNGRFDYRRYTQVELLEVSAVPVPSNRRALARAKGYFSDPDEKTVSPESIESLTKQIELLSEQLESVKSLLAASDGFAEALMLGEDSHRTQPADEEDITKTEQTLNTIKSLLVGE